MQGIQFLDPVTGTKYNAMQSSASTLGQSSKPGPGQAGRQARPFIYTVCVLILPLNPRGDGPSRRNLPESKL